MALRRLSTRRAAVVCTAALAINLLWHVPPASADIIRGVGKILMGVLGVPLDTIMGTFSGPPIIGTVMGLLHGLFNGVTMVLGGTFELAMDGLSVAKAIAPYLLPIFL